jgi:1,4-alpha-glucan branching enzyme
MFERAPEDEWRKFGNLRAFYSFMWSHPGKQLLFMGTEFGQRREFSEQRSLDWEESATWGHRGVQRLVKDMNEIYRANPALYAQDSDPAGFSWISADDQGGNVFSFLRFDGEGQMIACVSNFSAEPRADYRIGLPSEGIWTEILNTDAEVYDGTGKFGNLGQVVAGRVPSHGYPASAAVTIPPLGSVWLRFLPVTSEEQEDEAKVGRGVQAAAKQASPARKKAKASPPATNDASAAPKRSRKPKADAKPAQPEAATDATSATSAADDTSTPTT